MGPLLLLNLVWLGVEVSLPVVATVPAASMMAVANKRKRSMMPLSGRQPREGLVQAWLQLPRMKCIIVLSASMMWSVKNLSVVAMWHAPNVGWCWTYVVTHVLYTAVLYTEPLMAF